MAGNDKTIRVFTMRQQFPCGPQSACCGPIGQSEEEIANLTNAIENRFGCNAEVVDVMNGAEMRNHLSVLRVMRAFGPTALPIIALDGEVVSMGNPTPEEAVETIKEKMKQV
jgi:hypothetical protein